MCRALDAMLPSFDATHIDEQVALDCLEGRLSPSARKETMTHVDRCDACRQLLAVLARAIDEGGDPQTPEAVGADARIGDYVILDTIGAGAMGWVYRAHDPRLDRLVALKLVRHPAVSTARVRTEARALARLNHPNVVAVLASGRSEFGPWIVMEYVDGWTLDDWAAATSPSIEQRTRALLDAARGLDAAHAAGIVHGDFKPSNVLVGRDGRVRVADFGLASSRTDALPSAIEGRLEDSVEALGSVTGTHGPGGTPAYMAPEVLHGASPTFRSDQFSYCVAAWELLSAGRPFHGTTLELLLRAIETGSPTGSMDLPGAWRGALQRGLHVDPDTRHSGLRALSAAVRRPHARSSWAGRVIAATMLVGSAAWLWPQPNVCAEPARASERLLSETRRLAVHEGLAQAGHPAAETIDALNAWSSEWSEARRTACDGQATVPEQCLENTLAKLDGRLRALTEGESPSGGPLHGIRRPSTCLDASGTTSIAQSPAATRLRRELAVTRGNYAHRMREDSRRAFVLLVEKADVLGISELQGETRFTLARIHRGLGDRAASLSSYEAAYFYAIDAGDDETAVDSATGAAQIHGYNYADLENAERWLEHARSHLPSTFRSTGRVRLEMIHGEILMDAGRPDDAETHLDLALEIMPPETSLRLEASVYSTAAQLASVRQDNERATELFSRAVKLHESRGEAGAADLARPLNGLAAMAALSGRLEEAAALWTRAAALFDKRSIRDDYATLEVNLGVLRTMQGKHEAALVHYRTACTELVALSGDSGMEVASCFHNMALTYIELQRWPEAAAAARRAVAAALATNPPLIERSVSPLSNLGMTLAEMGDYPGAIAAYRRSVASRTDLVADGGTAELRSGLVGTSLDLVEILRDAGQLEAARTESGKIAALLAAVTEPEVREKHASRHAELAATLAPGAPP